MGFLGIACLLFFSGMLSLFELNRLSRGTDEILKANQRNIDLAKKMLDAAHEQNMAFIRLSVFREAEYDSLCRAGMDRLEQTFAVARAEAVDKTFLDSLAFATTELRLLTVRLLGEFAEQQKAQQRREEAAARADSTAVAAGTTGAVGAAGAMAGAANSTGGAVDSTAVAAPAPVMADFAAQEQYDRLYRRLTAAIQTYMTSTQSSLAPRTEQMKKNAYRAVTPVLISLVVMIAIVLLLYYFMLLYCVTPIIRINRSLGDFLAFRVPFRPKGEFQDELQEINEKIETLITLSKQPQNKD